MSRYAGRVKNENMFALWAGGIYSLLRQGGCRDFSRKPAITANNFYLRHNFEPPVLFFVSEFFWPTSC
jgi:hypothetical protein